MSTTETNKQNLQNILQAIGEGRLLEAFDTYYAQNCVMKENGQHDESRVGKEANRKYEEFFANNAEFHDFQLGHIVADGDVTGYDAFMDFTINGQRVKRHQFAKQVWEDGKIVEETFFYET
jgi:hypothetical protein